jgi:hypothetical protein
MFPYGKYGIQKTVSLDFKPSRPLTKQTVREAVFEHFITRMEIKGEFEEFVTRINSFEWLVIIENRRKDSKYHGYGYYTWPIDSLFEF